MSEKIYAERDIIGMDSKGGHYCRHISAMTREGLHRKSDIAAELGFRDMVIAELEAKCAALAAETHGFKRFFMFAINAAFDGCDITGDQIQEVAKEIGLVRVEPYSAEKHADMSGDPSIMEEGDDFYIMNKTPATDAFLAEVRTQGVEMVIAYHHERSDALAEVDRNSSFRHHSAAIDATDVLMKIRREAAQ